MMLKQLVVVGGLAVTFFMVLHVRMLLLPLGDILAYIWKEVAHFIGNGVRLVCNYKVANIVIAITQDTSDLGILRGAEHSNNFYPKKESRP